MTLLCHRSYSGPVLDSHIMTCCQQFSTAAIRQLMLKSALLGASHPTSREKNCFCYQSRISFLHWDFNLWHGAQRYQSGLDGRRLKEGDELWTLTSKVPVGTGRGGTLLASIAGSAKCITEEHWEMLVSKDLGSCDECNGSRPWSPSPPSSIQIPPGAHLTHAARLPKIHLSCMLADGIDTVVTQIFFNGQVCVVGWGFTCCAYSKITLKLSGILMYTNSTTVA